MNVPIRLIEMIVSNGISGCGPLEPATFCAQPVPAQRDRDAQPAVDRGGPLDGRLHLVLLAHVAGDELERPARTPAPAPFSALTSAIVTIAPRACSARDGRLAESRGAADDDAPEPSICIATRA